MAETRPVHWATFIFDIYLWQFAAQGACGSLILSHIHDIVHVHPLSGTCLD